MFRDFQIVIITNVVVVSSVGIKGVTCILLTCEHNAFSVCQKRRPRPVYSFVVLVVGKDKYIPKGLKPVT